MVKIPQKGDLDNCCPLLRNAIKAHGGLDKWRSLLEIVIRARSGGVALPMRFQRSAYKSYEAHIFTAEPRTVVTPFAGDGRIGIFEGDSVKILGSNDEVKLISKSAQQEFTQKDGALNSHTARAAEMACI